ncbi:MAG: site-specific recombinase, invertase Pin [Geminicoccaceae bacterium]|nr:site-specific recombinase, invertase Pin [Geminicoccaceae bacterium]
MMGVFAEFERAIIQEQMCAGLANARGKRLGRPKVPASVERAIRAARAAGKGQLTIARELRVGVGTVRRVWALTRIHEDARPVPFPPVTAVQRFRR